MTRLLLLPDAGDGTGDAPAPPAPAAGSTSAKHARKPPKGRREIELEIRQSQLEDELSQVKAQNSELEKFIAELSGKSAGKKAPAPAPTGAGQPPESAPVTPAGLDWPGFIKSL